MTTINSVVQAANDRARRLGAVGVITVEDWLALCERFEHRCLRCGEQKPLEIEHIEPLSKGGANTIDNIQPLCRGCNRRKHTKNTDYRAAPFTTDISGDKPSGAASYRYKGQMEQQIRELLLHYQKHDAQSLSANDILQTAVDTLWRQKVGALLPEPPHIVGWVRGKTTEGREGWKPQLSDGTILDEIDDDIED